MLGSKRNSKILMTFILYILFIAANNTEVLADSNSVLNLDRQMKFLEEKRMSQGATLQERQKNAVVEGMLSSEDLESMEKAELEKENEEKNDEIDGSNKTDTFSEMVKAIRRLQSRKQQTNKSLHRNTVNQTTTSNKYYKNTSIPIIKTTRPPKERLPISQASSTSLPGLEENTFSNSLLSQLNNIRDLMDSPVADRESIDMNSSDREMFEKIVMAESGAEPYLGQIAVANVILNRVKSKRYPSTLEGVIFQKFQFSPVKNGVIRGYAPNESVKKAVTEALNGRMIVPEDTLYFVNPVLATDQTIPRTKTPVKVIGSHTFYR